MDQRPKLYLFLFPDIRNISRQFANNNKTFLTLQIRLVYISLVYIFIPSTIATLRNSNVDVPARLVDNNPPLTFPRAPPASAAPTLTHNTPPQSPSPPPPPLHPARSSSIASPSQSQSQSQTYHSAVGSTTTSTTHQHQHQHQQLVTSTSAGIPLATTTDLVSNLNIHGTNNMAFAQTLLRKMLSDSVPEKHYDIYFVIRTPLRDGTFSQTKLGAHRVVLSAVSEKFEQHIITTTSESTTESESSTSNTHQESNIMIDNCSAAAVREALEIIYGGDLRDAHHSVALALDIWRFGVMFHVDHLIALARGSCINNLSTDNCLRILDFAVKVNDAQIVDKLQSYASETAHFSHVVSSPDFETLGFNVVCTLMRPGKGECAWPEILTFEKVWFDALIRWLTPRVSIPSSSSPSTTSPDTSTSVAEADKRNASITSNENDGDDQRIDIEQSQNKKQQQKALVVASWKLKKDEESVKQVETVLSLIDFSRMKTHELRDVSRNGIACLSSIFSHVLVDILLTRSEKLEASILERNIDLDVIGQKYQQALCEQDEAERKARAAFDKMDKLQAAKVALERRMEELRRRKTAGFTDSSAVGGPASASLNSARRKMSGTSTII